MIDQDLIRRAVELADGWCVVDDHDGYWLMFRDGDGWHSRSASRWWQLGLDALAAQLVRQVDAAGYDFESDYDGWATVSHPSGEPITHSIGPDRTENTIRACMEFFDGR